MHTRGSVPHFTLRPHPAVTMLFFFILVIGTLMSLSFLSMEEGAGQYRQKAAFTLSVTGVLCTILAILATSKLWFRHLWKKNSTHDRHKQHSHHHPAKNTTPPRSRR